MATRQAAVAEEAALADSEASFLAIEVLRLRRTKPSRKRELAHFVAIKLARRAQSAVAVDGVVSATRRAADPVLPAIPLKK